MATVLLVEPNDHLRSVFRRMFARAGFELVEAVDCDGAVGAAHDGHPDLIVVEGSVRDAHGQDLPLRLAHDPDLKQVPVIVLAPRQRDVAGSHDDRMEPMEGVAASIAESASAEVDALPLRQLQHPFRPRRLIELAQGTLLAGEHFDSAHP